MRKIWLLVLITGIMVILSGCQCAHDNTTKATCVNSSVCKECNAVIARAKGHNYKEIDKVQSTCTEKGRIIYECSVCHDTYTKELVVVDHAGEEKIIKEPTFNSEGEKRIICSMCGETYVKAITKLGITRKSPYFIKAYEFYNEILRGKFSEYEGKYLAVSGKVVSISDYGDLKGYYLYGKMGEGVVCWVDGKSLVATVGSQVVFVGRVQNLGSKHVELIDCILQKN